MTLKFKTYCLFSLVCINTILSPAYADFDTNFTNCSDSFYNKITPTYQNAKLAEQTYPLCFHGFAVLYSGQSRTPLWSAEHLTRKRIEQAEDMERKNSFHPENQVPASVRATLDNYSGSGYDRGHLAPNSDMANHNQQYDSFSLANISPQSPYLNRTIWKQVESATRYLTKVHGETFVLTGMVFKASYNMGKIDNAVSIPSHLYKVVYIPTLNQAGVYYAPNDESGRVEVISLEELSRQTGVNALPSLDEQVKSNASDLPLPNESFHDSAVASSDATPSHANANTEQANETSISEWITFLGTWLVGVVHWIRKQIRG